MFLFWKKKPLTKKPEFVTERIVPSKPQVYLTVAVGDTNLLFDKPLAEITPSHLPLVTYGQLKIFICDKSKDDYAK